MEHEVLYRPSYSLLRVSLLQGEAIAAEAGAMVSMSSGIEIETKAKGGIFGALKRSVLGGESFFVNTFRAERPGEITLAPTLPGDIHAVELSGGIMYAQSGAYIASSPEIEVNTKWGGAKTFFSREGLFLLKLSGTGPVFLSSYGAVHSIDLQPGQEYMVDTGHMVAFYESVGYAVQRVGGLKSTRVSGEGLVCRLAGPGKILIQTRSADAFLAWLLPQIPRKE